MPPKTLLWDGCLNVRDLGGRPTEDGGETRFGTVVHVRQLSDDGWKALVDYGVRTIVDLRLDSELEARHESAHMYLTQVGVAEADLDRARARLRG